MHACDVRGKQEIFQYYFPSPAQKNVDLKSDYNQLMDVNANRVYIWNNLEKISQALPYKRLIQLEDVKCE